MPSPYNDIDYWHSRRSFNDFKEFIDNFKSRSQVKNEKKHSMTETDDHNGKLIDEVKDYEIWYVGSHEAAKQLGRFYKGRSASWSTSIDDDYYWNNNYRNDTFYFLIKKTPIGDDFDKIAFQFRMNDLQIWDIRNRKNTFNDEGVISYMKEHYKWIDRVTDDIKYFRSPGTQISDNGDGTVNVIGDIYLDDAGIEVLPWIGKYKVKELFGSLYVSGNKLVSFEGFPEVIHGDLITSGNNFKNLENMPKVDGYKDI